MKSEGTFRNGDLWTGYKHQEEGHWLFEAIDKEGREYETDEIPSTPSLFTMRRYVGSWTAADFPRAEREP